MKDRTIIQEVPRICFIPYLKEEQIYGIFNIRFKGPKVWNSINENLKTSISNFKESVKSDLVKDY